MADVLVVGLGYFFPSQAWWVPMDERRAWYVEVKKALCF